MVSAYPLPGNIQWFDSRPTFAVMTFELLRLLDPVKYKVFYRLPPADSQRLLACAVGTSIYSETWSVRLLKGEVMLFDGNQKGGAVLCSVLHRAEGAQTFH